jgi:hypothetical protein
MAKLVVAFRNFAKAPKKNQIRIIWNIGTYLAENTPLYSMQLIQTVMSRNAGIFCGELFKLANILSGLNICSLRLNQQET